MLAWGLINSSKMSTIHRFVHVLKVANSPTKRLMRSPARGSSLMCHTVTERL